MTAKFDELVAKLKEIFQIDKPELDFGIYKIMNAKASMIRDFLNKDLKAKVQAALADKASAGKKALEEKIAKIEATLAPLGVPPASSPEWVAAKAELDKLAASDDSESLVYAHLLTFFSRYYDDGDFISKRRYKEGQYVVPYSGEEVKLVWANQDQYYTKSGENFTNYDFKLDDGKKVHFKLVTASVAKDNVKDNDAVRCFKLWDPANAEVVDDEEEREKLPDDILEEKDGELYIYFQYLKCKKGTKQADLLKDAIEKIAVELGAQQLATKFNILAPAPTEKDKSRTVLGKHLQRYVAKNTSDYFIHKDLRKFLTWELDAYVKNEMMNLDDISNAATFDAVAANLRLIQTFRLVAMELIGFMAQLEDFQKKLWLKKKFVVQCDYCITMDRVKKASEALYTEAKSNSAQIAEWEKLGITDDPTQSDLTAVDARMVDTRYFDEEFKAKLLRFIPDLDEQCDGVLICSENFQALKLIQCSGNKQVRTAFIDPPYNTEDSEGENDFLYKDRFQHSSWVSMIRDRIGLAKQLLNQKGILSYTISDKEFSNSLYLADGIFGEQNRIGIIEWNSTKSVTNKALISMGHTHIPLFANNREYFVGHRTEFRLRDSEEGFSNPDNDPRGKWKADPFQVGGVRPDQLYGITNPKTGVTYYPNSGNSWKNKFSVFQQLMQDNRIVFGVSGEAGPQRKRFWAEAKERGRVAKTWWDEEETTTNGTQTLKDLFANCPFKNPKPVGLLVHIFELCSDQNGCVLDFFAGSGTTAHAVIALNREDGGKRKYVLVEMGEHFDTVLKPRIEKVVYSPDWKDGKPTAGTKGISHCFKYMTLESYEDTLNNLKLEKPGELGLLKNEYLLNYMLEIESRKSLLNLDKFAHPFDYTLELAVDSSGATKPQKVDMVETFNCLIGLRVGLIDRHIDKGYVLVQGDLPNGEEALVLWRDLGKIDNDALKKILDKQAIHPREKGFVLYVNGDHNLPNIVKEEGEEKTIKVRSIEADFTRLMFEEE